jgi:DNA-binding NarL/FixJ family response regulator
MARVVVFVPDLLFGSRVIEAVRGIGHEPVAVADLDGLAAAAPGAGAVVVDLTVDAAKRIELVRGLGATAPPVLAFYSHVEADVRERAMSAGLDLVVPRSRMAREGPDLIARVLGSAPGADLE